MKLSPIYEVPLGAFIVIDGKPVKCKSRCKIGDRVYFNGEEIFDALESEVKWGHDTSSYIDLFGREFEV